MNHEEKEKIIRNYGKICERNSKISDVFKIKDPYVKGILLEEIREERGEEIDEILKLFGSD